MWNIVIGTLFVLISLWVIFMSVGMYLDINLDIDILKYMDILMEKILPIVLPLCLASIGVLFAVIGILFILGKM